MSRVVLGRKDRRGSRCGRIAGTRSSIGCVAKIEAFSSRPCLAVQLIVRKSFARLLLGVGQVGLVGRVGVGLMGGENVQRVA